MKNGFKRGIAKSLGSNYKLNQKALQIKKSWDEVARLLQAVNNPKKK